MTAPRIGYDQLRTALRVMAETEGLITQLQAAAKQISEKLDGADANARALERVKALLAVWQGTRDRWRERAATPELSQLHGVINTHALEFCIGELERVLTEGP